MKAQYLVQALEYHQRGWSILPISWAGKWKKPAVKWTPYQKRQPTEDELREWFKMTNLAGLAVVLGPVSGGLYCRDFDIAESYHRWANEHSQLAESLPKVLSKRGPHLYFQSTEQIRTRDYDDGELRGIGGYSILPPSVHESGHVYQWIIPLPTGPLPTIDPREAGFCRNWNCTEQTEEDTEDRGGGSGFSVVSVLSVQGALGESELIALATPTNSHQNHRCLFLLARGVRALGRQRGRELSTGERRKVFGAWYQRATPFLNTGQSKDEYWFEFLEGYERVKSPLGEEAITRAWKQAHLLQPPKAAEQFEHPQIRLLVALCRELQRAAGHEPFYLSCRTVQRLFRHDLHTTAALWLRGLVRSKIIEEVEKGGPQTNRASRYRYLHTLDD